MSRRIAALLAALTLLCGIARAEAFSGVVAAMSETAVFAEADGALGHISASEGARVEAGETLAEIRTQKVFAPQDGVIARIHCAAGQRCDGTVLELRPLERYQIYCTVDKAYQSAAGTRVRSGETVYIKCTKNGSHRGTGVIAFLDGAEYRVLALGGEFHVGETVYLYRDADFTTEQRVGIGTVVASDPIACEGTGKIARMCVAEGEYVERGELLFEVIRGEENVVRATDAAIVTEVCAAAGETVSQGQKLFLLVPEDALCVEARVSEAEIGAFRENGASELVFGDDPDETPVPGRIARISEISGEDGYLVRILPETDITMRLGGSVLVRVGE